MLRQPVVQLPLSLIRCAIPDHGAIGCVFAERLQTGSIIFHVAKAVACEKSNPVSIRAGARWPFGAGELRLDIRRPHIIGPAVSIRFDVMREAMIPAIDQHIAHAHLTEGYHGIPELQDIVPQATVLQDSCP